MGNMTVYAGAAFEESVSAVTDTPSVDLGSERVWKGETYKYCFNAGGNSINAGYGVALITNASGYSVAGTGVSDTPLPCVGVIKHTTMTTDAYAWVMTKGFMTVNTGNSILAAGVVKIGAQVVKANKGLTFGVCSGAPTVPFAGYKIQSTATASDGAFYACINCDL